MEALIVSITLWCAYNSEIGTGTIPDCRRRIIECVQKLKPTDEKEKIKCYLDMEGR